MGLSSCAKMSYLWEQGTGQLGLLWDGRPNSEVLADPNISDEVKNKIRLTGVHGADHGHPVEHTLFVEPN